MSEGGSFGFLLSGKSQIHTNQGKIMRPGIHKEKTGEVVENKSGHKFSKKPQSASKAHAQLRAIEAHIHNPSLGKSTVPHKSK